MGAVMHNSPVSRRDSPAALDEKQLVSLELTPQYELHNLTLTAAVADSRLQGAVVLVLGGKRSRPISVDASATVVSSAVRELLSNCEGAIGDELDPSGNTFDCWQGIGVTYRGLASVGVSGRACLDWRTTPIWHPSLAVLEGLEKNLCRNPTYDSSLGVWCYTAGMVKEACAVPQCGASLGGSNLNVALLASFEDEEDLGLSRTGAWDAAQGVVPTVVRDQAFCGSASLYIPNSFSQPRWAWRAVTSKQRPMYPYDLQTYPYICMAYRIPPGSEVSLQVGFAKRQDLGTFCVRTLGLTNSLSSADAPEIARFGAVQDGQWHYTCLNLLAVAPAGFVTDLRFWAEGQPTSTYASNPFWIDEFSIATTYRRVEQTQYPNLGGIIPRLNSVTRSQVPGGFIWTISLTSANCSAPSVLFDVDASSVVGMLGIADVSRVQDHSAPVEGSITLSFNGGAESAVFGAYSEAEEVLTRLSSLPSIKSVLVSRAGVCQTGFSWLVTFTNVPGDQPLLQYDGASLRGAHVNATLVVEAVTDGGLLMAPLSADYFHLPSDTPTLNVWVGGSAAVCTVNATPAMPTGCRVDFQQNLTPVINSANTASAYNSAMSTDPQQLPSYVIAGIRLTPPVGNETASVLISDTFCPVISASETLLVCRLSAPITSGVHAVRVNVPLRGWSDGDVLVFFPLTVISVWPTSISAMWPTVLQINGSGFNCVDLQANQGMIQITVSGMTLSINCTPLNVTAYQLYCLTSTLDSRTLPSSNRRSASTGTFTMLVGSQAAAGLQLSSVALVAPAVYSVTPTRGSSGGGTLVSVQGLLFSGNEAQNSVFLGGTLCEVVNSDPNIIICKAPPSPPGAVNVSVYVEGVGLATSPPNAVFEYVLEVTKVNPVLVGVGGGVTITALGAGFQTADGRQATPVVLLPGWTIFVVGLYTPQQFTDIQDIVLSTQYTNDVQVVSLIGKSVTSFTLTIYQKETSILPRNINQYVLQGEMQKLLGQGSVRIFRQDFANGTIRFQIEFRGNQGSMPLIKVAGCNVSGAICSENSGIVCNKIVDGVAPTGNFRIGLAGDTFFQDIPVDASAEEMFTALSNFPIPGGVMVNKFDKMNGPTWRITFRNVQAKKFAFTVDSTGMSAGTVIVRKVREGTVAPSGSWQLALGGVLTRRLALNASELDVEAAIAERVGQWKDVVTAEVIQVDNAPGAYLNRFYPRQWVIRLQRWNAAGKGQERCTNPTYIDWDPSSCPTYASDLYLSYYSYYWPSLLPKPDNLGSLTSQQAFQTACDSEARSLKLTVTSCQALRPSEVLPYCGIGSGVQPPCWNIRFSDATVRFASGETVRFSLDLSAAPSNTEKGYTFWRRVDEDSVLQQQTLGINYTIDGSYSGMHVRLHDAIAGSKFRSNTSLASESTMEFVLPSLTKYLRPYSTIVQMDVLTKPVLEFRYNYFMYNGIESPYSQRSVAASIGLMLSGQGTSISAVSRSSIILPLQPLLSSDSFSLDMWIRLEHAPPGGTCAVILRALTTDSVEFALTVCGKDSAVQQTFQFWLNTSRQGRNPGDGSLSIVDGTFGNVGSWAHLALVFDGRIQQLYGDGVLVNFTDLNVTTLPQLSVELLVIGSGCNDACSSINGCSGYLICNSSNDQPIWADPSTVYLPFEGHLDWILLYSTALSANTIALHAAIVVSSLHMSITAQFNDTVSLCVSCEVKTSPNLTPSIFGIDPSNGTPGSTVTVYGNFLVQSSSQVTVLIGAQTCSVLESTKFQITCVVSPLQALGVNIVSVSVSGFGKSNELNYPIAPEIRSILPKLGGSLGGGATLTLLGSGFQFSDLREISVSFGEIECNVIAASFSTVVCVLGMKVSPLLSSYITLQARMSIFSVQSQQRCNSTNATLVYSPSYADIARISCSGPATFSAALPMVYQPDLTSSLAGLCTIVMTSSQSASIINISPRIVSEGTLLTIQGRDLDVSNLPPVVTVGDWQCQVTMYNQSHILCTVGQGEGGLQAVLVRFARGYALDFSTEGCLESKVTYIPSVSSVTPSFGSAWGGATVTVRGTGFSQDLASNSILIGSFLWRISSMNNSDIVAIAQPSESLSETQTGLERSIYLLLQCTKRGAADCLAPTANGIGSLQACVSSFPLRFLQSAFLKTSNSTKFGIVISPPSPSDSEVLVDSNLNTVWVSSSGDENVYIALDIGSNQNVSSIKFLWAANYSAANLQVYFATECNQIVATVNRSFCWPWSKALNVAQCCGNGSETCSSVQSSTALPYSAAKALDGDQGQGQIGRCSQTKQQVNPWWRVDFNSTKSIRGGRIWNRRDSFAENLDRFQVWIGDGQQFNNSNNTLCFTASNTPVTLFSDNFSVPFDCVGTGRYLYVVLPRTDILSICEIEVYEASRSCVVPSWNQVDLLSVNTVARYIVIALLKWRESKSEYRLRDIRVQGSGFSQIQAVHVSVNSILSQCQEEATCLFAFNEYPQVESVQPPSGVGGDQIVVTGSGFSTAQCLANSIIVGALNCRVTLCTDISLVCTIPEQAAGNYSIFVLTPGGRARGLLTFQYRLVLSSIAPSEGGFGGEYPLMLVGHGFNTLKNPAGVYSENQILICGVACSVKNSSAGGVLSCIQQSLVQVADVPGRRSFDIQVNADALEYAVAYCKTYTMINSKQTCICDSEDWMCYRSRYNLLSGNKAAMTAHWRNTGQAQGKVWGCNCTGTAGAMVLDGYQLGFDMVSGGSLYSDWSPQVVYLRFESVDIPSNSTVSSATLRLFSSGSTCLASSSIRIWAEAAGNSAPLEPSLPGALFRRRPTQSYVDWSIVDGWKWANRLEESADLSVLLSEVIRGTEWRNNNAITLILRQRISQGGGPCRFLASEAGNNYAPVLRVSLDNAQGNTTPDSLTCRVDVVVRPSALSWPPLANESCGMVLSAVASTWFPTPGVLDIPLNPAYVPMSEACCGSSGHQAYLALDTLPDTFWLSQNTNATNFTVELGESGSVVTRMKILWTTSFASNYSVMVSSTGLLDDWTLAQVIKGGDGGTDEFDLVTEMKRILFLRICMFTPGTQSQQGFGIFEVTLFGCSQDPSGRITSISASFPFTAIKSLNPTIFSLQPTVGTTAGGTKVTLSGVFGVQEMSKLKVDIGGFDCSLISASLPQFGAQSLLCSTARVGVAYGGLKYVKVVSSDQGAGAASEASVFWYIDRWSAKTTWGGNLPPTGCGDYVVDQGCTESVVIPEGQVILMDVSPPRLFLLLIQGTLIFDRRDLQLQVLHNYFFNFFLRYSPD